MNLSDKQRKALARVADATGGRTDRYAILKPRRGLAQTLRALERRDLVQRLDSSGPGAYMVSVTDAGEIEHAMHKH